MVTPLTRDPVARENLAVLRHLALSRLKNDDTKLGLQNVID
jgi:hypothetical protein